MRASRAALPAFFIALAVSRGAEAAFAQVAPEPVPYVPTSKAVVSAMLTLAEPASEDVMYDLGSGDGRIVITAATRFGTRGVGYEIDPVLVERSRASARAAGVDSLVRFVGEDLFAAELGGASIVTLFLSPDMNLQLLPKLLRELAPGARVVSHAFHMGDWPADRVLHVGEGAERATVYMWVVPVSLDGFWEMTIGRAGESRSFVLEVDQRFQTITGSIRRGGAPIARVTGSVRGTWVELRAEAAVGMIKPGLDGAVFTGHLQEGEIRGVHRRAGRAPAGTWRISTFRP